MGELGIEVDPGQVGLDADRLSRIDRHFARYVDDGRLPGWLVLVAREGRIAHLSTYGWRDVEASLPVELDTVWRIYSMSKPITSVAAMVLYEQGAFELKDPIHRWLPEFRDLQVYRSGSTNAMATEAATEPIRVWHLLTHMAGLTYGFHHAHPVDARYRLAGFEWGTPPGADLAECCRLWAGVPLVHQPGAEWNYSHATDVLGRLVEVLTGETLDVALRRLVLEPLGMHETGFALGDLDPQRLGKLYVAGPDRRSVHIEGLGDVRAEPPTFLGGGGGLVSTAADYHRFCRFLLGEGELDGVRLLGDRTFRMMVANHLPGGVDLEAIGRPLFAETTFAGVGFGLGFSVTLDPVANKVPGSPGDYGWGGAASTAFWIDPVERLSVIFMTQLLPSSTHPIRSQLKQLVFQALR